MNRLFIIFFCTISSLSIHAMEPNGPKEVNQTKVTPSLATASAEARVILLDYDSLLCIQDENAPGQLLFPGGVVNSKEKAVDAACRKLKEQLGIELTHETLKLIALVNRVNANPEGYSDYAHYYLAANTGHRVSEEAEGIFAFVADPDEILRDRIFDRTSKEGFKASPAIKTIVQHIKDGCKTSGTRHMLDYRQLNKPREARDLTDTMTVELFAHNISGSNP